MSCNHFGYQLVRYNFGPIVFNYVKIWFPVNQRQPSAYSVHAQGLQRYEEFILYVYVRMSVLEGFEFKAAKFQPFICPTHVKYIVYLSHPWDVPKNIEFNGWTNKEENSTDRLTKNKIWTNKEQNSKNGMILKPDTGKIKTWLQVRCSRSTHLTQPCCHF